MALRKIIKHGPTRWLSLHNCVTRLLEQWEPLTAFFTSEKSSTGTATARLNRICGFFDDPASQLYTLFLRYVLPKFINANLLLQKEEPVIHLMRRRLHEVATDLLVAFVKPSAITKCENIYTLEHQRRSKQKDREDLQIGEDARSYLEKSEAMVSAIQPSPTSMRMCGHSIHPLWLMSSPKCPSKGTLLSMQKCLISASGAKSPLPALGSGPLSLSASGPLVAWMSLKQNSASTKLILKLRSLIERSE